MVKSTFFKKTSILMVSNIISGILAFIFSIILSREIGSKGVGLYQLVMPLNTILIYITAGGISVAMSRLAAQKKAEGRLRELYRMVRVVCLIEILWTVLIVGLVMLSANFISSRLLSDSRTFYSILAFCPALILVSLSSTYRGMYYGVQRVFEPALIEIIEKSIKILLMYPMVMVGKGMSLEMAAGGAILALSCGELISFLLFFISFRKYKRLNPGGGRCDNDFQLAFNVFKISVPISLEGVITAIFGTISAILIPKRLQVTGISYEEALSLLGKLQGMAMNIAFFPMLITTAFNMLLIPSIAESAANKNNKLLAHRINSAIRLASVTSSLTASIILADPIEIGCFFYKDPVVGRILAVIAPALPIIYLELISYAILNGLGKQTKLLINSIIVQTLDIILLYIFIGTPWLNIYGYALNITLASILGIFINYRLIIRSTGLSLNWCITFGIPMLCGFITYLMASNILFKCMTIPVGICITIVIYISLYIQVNKLLSGANI